MQIVSQLGLMFRAHLLDQTTAKVSLAVRHYSHSRYASALKAIGNDQRRFADTCCRRPISVLEASTWGARQGDLNLRLQGAVRREVITQADQEDRGAERVQSFCQQLRAVRRLMGDQAHPGNRNCLTQIIGDGGFNIPPLASAAPQQSPIVVGAEQRWDSFAHGSTFESQCKVLADTVWSGDTATWDTFNARLQHVVQSGERNAPGGTAHATCLLTFEIIEYVRQRAPFDLASNPRLAANWDAWSARAEGEAAAHVTPQEAGSARLDMRSEPAPASQPTPAARARRVRFSEPLEMPPAEAKPRVSFLYPANAPSYSAAASGDGRTQGAGSSANDVVVPHR